MPATYVGLSLVIFAALFSLGLWCYVARRQAHLRASVASKTFMTGNEIEFFGRLGQALPEFHVFPQVSMGALLEPTVSSKHPDYWKVRDTFSQKVCDFVVCQRGTMAPLFIVELDDRTHDFAKDALRDDIVAQGSLRTVRFWSRKKPTRAEIREKASRVLGAALKFSV